MISKCRFGKIKMETHYCSRCKETKSVQEFSVDKKRRNKLTIWCKTCTRKYFKQYYKNHPEKAAEYRKNHRVQMAAYNKQYQEKHRVKSRAYGLRYHREHRDQKLQYLKDRRRDDPLKYMLHAAQQRAGKAGIKFDLRRNDIEMPDRCPIFGTILIYGGNQREDNSASLDRINPLEGYIPGNCWIISDRANRIKNDASIDDLRAVITALEAKSKETKRVLR